MLAVVLLELELEVGNMSEKLSPDTLNEWFTKIEHHLLSFNHPHFVPDFLFSVENKKRENVLATVFPCDAYDWSLGLSEKFSFS